MNPVDTLRLILDQQAAMRRDARVRGLTRSCRRGRSTRDEELVKNPDTEWESPSRPA